MKNREDVEYVNMEIYIDIDMAMDIILAKTLHFNSVSYDILTKYNKDYPTTDKNFYKMFIALGEATFRDVYSTLDPSTPITTALGDLVKTSLQLRENIRPASFNIIEEFINDSFDSLLHILGYAMFNDMFIDILEDKIKEMGVMEDEENVEEK